MINLPTGVLQVWRCFHPAVQTWNFNKAIHEAQKKQGAGVTDMHTEILFLLTVIINNFSINYNSWKLQLDHLEFRQGAGLFWKVDLKVD